MIVCAHAKTYHIHNNSLQNIFRAFNFCGWGHPRKCLTVKISRSTVHVQSQHRQQLQCCSSQTGQCMKEDVANRSVACTSSSFWSGRISRHFFFLLSVSARLKKKAKNSVISIPCHSVKMETWAHSIQQKTKIVQELSSTTNDANGCSLIKQDNYWAQENRKE